MDDTPNQLGYRSSRCSIEELEREEGLERKKRILERDNAIVRIVISQKPGNGGPQKTLGRASGQTYKTVR